MKSTQLLLGRSSIPIPFSLASQYGTFGSLLGNTIGGNVRLDPVYHHRPPTTLPPEPAALLKRYREVKSSIGSGFFCQLKPS
jgi:hypothetical protein